MNPPQPQDVIDWHTLFNYVGYGFMGLFTVLSGSMWKDVQKMKSGGLTREEFHSEMKQLRDEREDKHKQSVSGLGEIHEKVNALNDRVYEGQLAIERRLGDVATTIAALRPHRPDGGPERRRGY